MKIQYHVATRTEITTVSDLHMGGGGACVIDEVWSTL